MGSGRHFLALSIVTVLLSGCGTSGGEQAPSKQLAPGVPISKHGDNSIQTWGVEGSSGERARAMTIVRAYLDARAARHWGAACSYLATESRVIQSGVSGGRGCAKGMALLSSKASSSELAAEAVVRSLSFRVGGGYAFVIYRRPDGVFATGLTRAAGGWKIVNSAPSPLS